MRIHRGYLFWGIVFVLLGGIPLAERSGLIDAQRLSDVGRLWPLLLIAIGGLTTLHVLFPVQTHRFWPLLLVIAGIYLLNQFRRNKSQVMPETNYRTPPPSVIQSNLDSQTHEFARANRRFDA